MKLIHKLRLKFNKSSILGEIDSYRAHSVSVEALLEKEVTKFEKHHEEAIAKLSAYEAAEYDELMSDQYWELAETHPSIQRKSELICIYSLLEIGLNKICGTYEAILDTPVKLSDLTARGNIDKAKKYLQKSASVDFPEDSAEWKEISCVQQLRNCLVHADGVVNDKNEKLLRYVNESSYLELDDKNRVIIGKGFTVHCLGLFRRFLEKLFNKIKE